MTDYDLAKIREHAALIRGIARRNARLTEKLIVDMYHALERDRLPEELRAEITQSYAAYLFGILMPGGDFESEG